MGRVVLTMRVVVCLTTVFGRRDEMAFLLKAKSMCQFSYGGGAGLELGWDA